MNKSYRVYFIIKKNNHGYLNEKVITASNQKDAIKLVREKVREESGRNAFHCTCKAPKKVKDGMEFDGFIYKRYSELFNSLW